MAKLIKITLLIGIIIASPWIAYYGFIAVLLGLFYGISAIFIIATTIYIIKFAVGFLMMAINK